MSDHLDEERLAADPQVADLARLQSRSLVLEGLLESSSSPIFSVDTAYCYTSFNTSHAHVMNALYGAEIEVGQNILDYQTVDDDRRAAQANLDRALRGERVVEEAFSGEDARERRYFSVTHDPVRDEGGIVGVAVQALDVTELRRGEHQQRLLSDSIEASLNEIYIFSVDTLRFRFVNHSAQQNLGYTAAQLHAMTPLDIEPDFTREAFAEVIAPLIRHERPQQVFRAVHQRADGSRYPVEVHLQLLEREPEPVIVAVILDITARIQAEQALRESEDKFSYIFDHSVISMSLTQPGGGLHVNDAFCRMLGYSREELESRTWQEVSHPDDIADTLRQVERLQSGAADSARFVKRYLRKDGAVVWADVATAIRRTEDGRPLYYMTAIVDITDRVRAEEEVREREEHLRFLIDQTPTVNWTLDRDLRFTLSRGGGLPALGLAPDQVLDMHIRDHLGGSGQQADLGVAMHKRALLGESFAYEQPVGDLVFDIMLGPLRDADGAIVGVIGVAYDATARLKADEARREAEQEVAALNVELEQRVLERTAQLAAANQELEAFAYSVSHDLRAPLRHISGFANVLAEVAGDALDDESNHCVEAITTSVSEMGALIDDLLQFSRTGRAELRIADVDMGRALSEALLPLQRETAGRDLEWSIGALPHVVGDHTLLRQVWSNLLDNAVKYSRNRAPARIAVGVRDGDGDGDARETVFFVRDNGVGFDMQYADKLFGVFQRLHRSAEFEGTGIGLANVQCVITRLGGRVWAEAEPDKGATFLFSLPNEERHSGTR